MSEEKLGFITVTYRVRLYNRHQKWLIHTRQLYNRVVWHYYQILRSKEELLEQGNFLVLRALEEMSIGTKEMKAQGKEPLWKLENLPKIPLYFRRAAINAAIGLARTSFTSCKKRGKEKEETFSQVMDASPVFYKGMYREFQRDSIQLKLYNGEKWVWVTYPYTGREFPLEGTFLSPTLKVEKKAAYLHVPIEKRINYAGTVREQVKEGKRICAVAFPDQNNLAVCAILEGDGSFVGSYFISGGRAREAQRRKVLERLEKSRKSRGFYKERKTRTGDGGIEKIERDSSEQGRENQVLYQKLEQINQYYVHKVSREILEYCKRNRIGVIVVPNYENSISFQKKAYLKTNSFRWQGRGIIRNLKYKAFQEGILVTSIRPHLISACCSECGEKIQRYNEGHKASQNYYGGQLFVCPNGHRGNAALNTAKNIGRYFLRSFKKEEL